MGPARRSDRKSSPISEIDVLWITAGLGCDGDTIAMTAATQPSIEDIVLGALPWIPKVHFYNPFLASENGEDFMAFPSAAEGKSNPFILVMEGSIPDETNKKGGLLGIVSAPTSQPVSPLRPVNGSTGWRRKHGQSLPREPARPTAEFMPWKAIPPDAWGCPIILVGSGARKGIFPSFAFPDARSAGQFHGDAPVSAPHGRRARPHDPAR
jgi:hypothetical protein